MVCILHQKASLFIHILTNHCMGWLIAAAASARRGYCFPWGCVATEFQISSVQHILHIVFTNPTPVTIHFIFYFSLQEQGGSRAEFLARPRTKFESRVASWHADWCNRLSKGPIDQEEYSRSCPKWQRFFRFQCSLLKRQNVYPDVYTKDSLLLRSNCSCSLRHPSFEGSITYWF